MTVLYVTARACWPDGQRWVSVVCRDRSQIALALESVSANQHCPPTTQFEAVTVREVTCYEP